MNQIFSATPSLLENNVSFIIASKVTTLGAKIPPYDQSKYDMIPLKLFEIIHFGTYLSIEYNKVFSHIRLATNLTKTKESKEILRCFNSIKWTRQVLNASTQSSSIVIDLVKNPSMKLKTEKNLGALSCPVLNTYKQ